MNRLSAILDIVLGTVFAASVYYYLTANKPEVMVAAGFVGILTLAVYTVR